MTNLIITEAYQLPGDFNIVAMKTTLNVLQLEQLNDQQLEDLQTLAGI